MDGFLVLLGLAILAIPMAVIYLLVSFSRLKTRVAAIESGIERLMAERPDAAIPAGPNISRPDDAPSVQDDTSPEVPEAASDTGAGIEETTEFDIPRDVEPAIPEDAGPDQNLPPAARVIAERRAASDPRAADAPRAPGTTPDRASPPASIGSSFVQRFFTWLVANWFYVVSGVSLALAGLFLVQYGIENGYLPPTARVIAALAFGAALIVGGEFIRRQFGDAPDSDTAYLPSVFSGAGLVSLFGGVTAARLLYSLVGVETAFAGLAFVGLIGVGLGWLHGPLLAAIGVIGAFGAPLLVGSDVPATAWLFGYFAVVAAVGLGIDTIRRWAWVSLLTMSLAFGMGGLTYVGGPNLAPGFEVYVLGLVVLAILIPARSFWPDHEGTMVTEFVVSVRKEQPRFPTVLAAGSVAAASFVVAMAILDSPDTFWLGVGGLSLLSVVLIVWSVKASALQDLALAPAAAIVAVVAREGMGRGPVWAAFSRAYEVSPEADFPMAVTLLWAIGVALSAFCAMRAMRPGIDLGWGLGAALAAPVIAIVLELTWQPALVIGAYPWALHGIVMAALMVTFALRFARLDGDDRTRVSVFVLSALASITFAMVLVLSSAALTVAIAVTVAVAAALDRRFNLRLMQIFITVGVATVGVRLVADPGLDWAFGAPLWELVLAYGGALATFVAGLWLLRGKDRRTAQVMLDTAAWSTAGILSSLLLFRGIENATGKGGNDSHWAMGLFATIWLVLMLVQLVRLEALSGTLAAVRAVLAAVFALAGLVFLFNGLTIENPLLLGWSDPVVGPKVLNTLAVAYLLPALVLAYGAWRLQRRIMRLGLAGSAVVLAAFWAFAALRHLWQGAEGMPLSHGFLQSELYSYTVAILLVGGALFYQSLARRSSMLRRAGLVVIGLAVAKVFLIDISDLQGLTRVFSLLFLGLSLAGLAWLDRWAKDRARPE